MEDRRVMVFDASPYMLFEASGDSDGAFELESDIPAAAEENDAQSCCSYGILLSAGVLHEADAAAGGGVDDFDDGRSGDDEEEGGGGGCSDDEEDGVVDQCRRNENSEKSSKASGACEDPRNVREEDKLFWEACLDS